MTLVLGDYRAVYNAGGRFRGGWRQYNSPRTSGAYSIELPKSDRVKGAAELKLDLPGQNGKDRTKQRERHGFWMARQVGMPYNYLHFVWLFVDGTNRGLLHDAQTPDSDFAQSIHPWDANPQIFKLYRDRGYTCLFNILTEGEKDKATYRWYWRKRRTPIPDDDFSPLYTLIDALTIADNDAYHKNVSALMNIDQGMGYFAMNDIFVNGDSYGRTHPHNTSFYFPPHAGCMFFLYDLDFTLSGNTSAALFTGGDATVNRMEKHPAFRRVWLRYYKNAIEGPMLSTHSNARLNAWHDAFTASYVQASDPSTIASWIESRRRFILGQSAAWESEFAITTNGGDDVTTDANSFTLRGTSPIETKFIQVNETNPFFYWDSITEWRVTVPAAGRHECACLQGLRPRGHLPYQRYDHGDLHGNRFPRAAD